MTVARIALYGLAVAPVPFGCWRGARGARRRRFARAFPPGRAEGWSAEDAPFLEAFERAFALRRGWAARIPPGRTPMDVYLALYPEHCIYDDSELTRLRNALGARLGGASPKEPLTQPLGALASLWRGAPERSRP